MDRCGKTSNKYKAITYHTVRTNLHKTEQAFNILLRIVTITDIYEIFPTLKKCSENVIHLHNFSELM